MAYAFVGGTCYDYDLPTKFLEAWDHPVEYDRNKWRAAILKELNDMISKLYDFKKSLEKCQSG